MKKSIFIFAALLAATFANAQITLERTFNHQIDFGWGISTLLSGYYSDTYIIGNYLYEEDEDSNSIQIYDAKDCSLIKTLNMPQETAYRFISRGIFTTDNKWSFVCFKRTEIPGSNNDGPSSCNYYYSIQVQTEDGTVLATLNNQATCSDYLVTLAKVGDAYKLVARKDGKYYYYSLPGNGETESVSNVSAPRRNARKYLHNDQVLIENTDHTYTITGQEVR